MAGLYWHLVLRRPRAVIVGCVVLFAVSVWGISRAHFRAAFDPQSFLSPEEYRGLEQGSGEAPRETIAIILTAPADRPVPLGVVEALSERLVQLSDVGRVWSEASFPTTQGADFFKMDAHSSLLLVEPAREGYASIGESRALEGRLRGAVAEAAGGHGIGAELVGGPMLRVAVHAAFARDAVAIFLPLAILILVIPIVVYRSVRPVLLPAAVGLLATAATFAFAGATGRHFTYFSLTLAPFLLCYSLFDTLFIVDRFSIQGCRGETVEAAIARCIRELWFPCLLTSLTTLIGFATLTVTSKTPLLQEYGLFAAVGLAASFGITFLLIPASLRLSPSLAIAAPRLQRWGRPITRSALFSRAHPRAVLLMALVAVALLVPSLKDLRVEGVQASVFPKGDRVQEGIDRLSAHLGSITPITLTMYSTEPEKSSRRRFLTFAWGLERWLEHQPFVKRTLSALDFVPIPEAPRDPRETWYARLKRVERELGGLPLGPYAERAGNWFTLDERGEPRTIAIQAWPQALVGEDVQQMMRSLENFNRTMMAEFRFRIGGPFLVDEAVKRRFLREALQNFACSAILVLLITLVPLRSFALSVTFLTANAIPLVLLFGLMGATGTAFTISLVCLPCILLGILVDNTIHVLWSFKRAGSLRAAYEEKGRAMVLSSLLLIVAFGGEVLSRFVANQQFGGFAAAGIGLGLMANLWLVPALLQLFRADHLDVGREER